MSALVSPGTAAVIAVRPDAVSALHRYHFIWVSDTRIILVRRRAYVILDTSGATVGPSAGTADTAPAAEVIIEEMVCVHSRYSVRPEIEKRVLTVRKGPSAEATPPTDVMPDAGVAKLIPSTSATSVVSAPAASARPPMSAPPPLVLAAADVAASVEGGVSITILYSATAYGGGVRTHGGEYGRQGRGGVLDDGRDASQLATRRDEACAVARGRGGGGDGGDAGEYQGGEWSEDAEVHC